jgi:hypothetical protein
VLRFGSKPSSKPSSFAGGSSRGVWKLLLLLGLVMVMIRQLDRPEAGAMLGRVLGIDNQPADGVASPTADAATFQPATVEGERDDARQQLERGAGQRNVQPARATRLVSAL